MTLDARRSKSSPEDELVARILATRPWDGFWYKITMYLRRYSITIFVISWFVASGLKWFICIIAFAFGLYLDKTIQRNAKDINYSDEKLIREIVEKKVLVGYYNNKQNIKRTKKFLVILTLLFVLINLPSFIFWESPHESGLVYLNLDYVFSSRVLDNYQDGRPLALYYHMYFSNVTLALFVLYFVSINFPLRNSDISDVKYLSHFHRIPYLSSFGITKFRAVSIFVLLSIIISTFFINIIRWNVDIPNIHSFRILLSTLWFSVSCIIAIMYLGYAMKVSAILVMSGIAKA